MTTKQLSLDALWESAISQERVFRPDDVAHLPETVKRYLDHAIALGTVIANKVLIKILRAS